jgi:hypothetical protein
LSYLIVESVTGVLILAGSNAAIGYLCFRGYLCFTEAVFDPRFGWDNSMESIVDETIAVLIRRLRTDLGMTQAALAERLAEASGNLSITRGQINRWERIGGRVPSPYWRHWLAVTLEVPRDELETAARCGRVMQLMR